MDVCLKASVLGMQRFSGGRSRLLPFALPATWYESNRPRILGLLWGGLASGRR